MSGSYTNHRDAFEASHWTRCDSKAVNISTLSISLALAIRVILILLFLPFSALDKNRRTVVNIAKAPL